MIFLVKPSIEYKESFIKMVCELEKRNQQDSLNSIELRKNFSAFLRACKKRETKPKIGWVPDTTFWLIVNDKCTGTINIRHYLNENLIKFGGHIGYGIRPSERKKGYGTLMLKLALEECKKMDLKKVLITCDPENIGSAKIIQNNGGILENEILVDIDGKMRRTSRYWIDIK